MHIDHIEINLKNIQKTIKNMGLSKITVKEDDFAFYLYDTIINKKDNNFVVKIPKDAIDGRWNPIMVTGGLACLIQPCRSLYHAFKISFERICMVRVRDSFERVNP